MGNKAPKLTPEEEAKQNKRAIQKTIRQIERERTKLQNQEAKTLKQIKDLATKNQHGPAKIMSKDLVRSRQQVNMYYTFASQLRVIETQLASAQMNANMASNLSGVVNVMGRVNAQMNPQQMVNTMKDFSKEMEKMGIQQDMMADAMDMVGDGDTDAQAEEVYNQILGEVGMGVG